MSYGTQYLDQKTYTKGVLILTHIVIKKAYSFFDVENCITRNASSAGILLVLLCGKKQIVISKVNLITKQIIVNLQKKKEMP